MKELITSLDNVLINPLINVTELTSFIALSIYDILQTYRQYAIVKALNNLFYQDVDDFVSQRTRSMHQLVYALFMILLINKFDINAFLSPLANALFVFVFNNTLSNAFIKKFNKAKFSTPEIHPAMDPSTIICRLEAGTD
uniref:Uncharacterized protein n=1 Tax=Glossina brevipalpis TaxID=37001 RepID=A0A1A9WH45_9MUSC